MNKTIFIFGGVDTNQQRFNDLFSYEVENRKWSAVETTGPTPQQRTFHKSVIFNNIMYVVGGFDGTRLNDLYHIALPGSMDIDEIHQSVQRFRPSSSSASGMMRTVPSDLVSFFDHLSLHKTHDLLTNSCSLLFVAEREQWQPD